MRVRDKHEIYSRQVAHTYTRTPQPFQQHEPLRVVRIDKDVKPANLDKERGMSDERDPHILRASPHKLHTLARGALHHRVSRQLRELRSLFSERDLKHLAYWMRQNSSAPTPLRCAAPESHDQLFASRNEAAIDTRRSL